MIYTIGHTENYERYFEEQGTPQKLGRTADYAGGSVWKTQEEAQRGCPDGYSVYGVLADWEKDTAPTVNDWNDLLVTSDLCKVEQLVDKD